MGETMTVRHNCVHIITILWILLQLFVFLHRQTDKVKVKLRYKGYL